MLANALAQLTPADAGVVWGELPDNAATITDGPERSQPYAHNPRVDSRLPRGATVGQAPGAHTGRHRVPAEVQPDSDEAAQWAATPGDQWVRPADSSEALVWREPVQVRPDVITPGRLPTGVVVELVRVDLPDWRLATIERLATYLRVEPVDGGDVFVTDGCGCYDPFPVFVSPAGPLTVRWSLIGLSAQDPGFDGLPAHTVPSLGVQLQPHWFDLRYGWGQRYTTGLQLEVPSGVTSVRLLATIESAGAWRVRVGGRLGVWWIPGGPRGAALEAATRRTT